MEKTVKKGDLVESKAGRDKGEIFLVIDVKREFVFLVNGKVRKVLNPKKKNIKHIKLVSAESLNGLAERIQSGQPVGNERVKKEIKSAIQKIQED